ncbi:cation efflux family-domain-containing protein [Thamnocephalis sphaerospora]|uniref:Cation efflux family-domain-containing protein n=1 Tax=Thamnocephalis sphaerospora TaxID=78915 RepID=A0A4P9XTZ0_9FUNG|nr:cation efflux family-domain-containing protein [Thamnocephalis sphaerospora]|eukprot:RKP09675.1 cation efflux family-domain-containing protein [Thamnocephalis sphaerospora]
MNTPLASQPAPPRYGADDDETGSVLQPLPDPLQLRQALVDEGEVQRLQRSRKSRQRRLGAFYEEQNELIDELLKPVGRTSDDVRNEAASNRRAAIAVYGSMGVNVMLFILQLTAAIASGSLALFATMADSFMDLLSGAILTLASREARKENIQKYPTGKSRMETIGIIVFSSLMATVSVQLIVESIRTLIASADAPDMPLISVLFVSIALASKLGLFFYCYSLRDSPSAQILAQDHRNDLFVNSFGLAMSLLAHHYQWWLDPAGAIAVSLIILRSWTHTAYEQIQLIVGKAADPAFLKRIIYIAFTHHEDVLHVDTAHAYHVGNRVYVEVDIVMDPDTTLRYSHDIGESLQMKLESLPNVERAFVHVDYEFEHKPEHRKYK